jgi:DNA-binding NarL/FixJ family response regulator
MPIESDSRPLPPARVRGPARHVLASTDRRILRWLEEGHPHAQIRRRLHLSKATLEERIRTLMARLAASSRAELLENCRKILE